VFIFLYIKVTSNVFIELFYIPNNKKLYKLKLSDDTKIQTEDCDDKCDQANCIKLKDKLRVLNECVKCNKQKNKCFTKSIIGGNCDDCINDEESKLDCYNVNNFGCSNNNNLQINKGVSPYYIQVPDNNINSPYNKKCAFCWNILDNI
jgi:hypothetical protein